MFSVADDSCLSEGLSEICYSELQKFATEDQTTDPQLAKLLLIWIRLNSEARSCLLSLANDVSVGDICRFESTTNTFSTIDVKKMEHK